MQVSAVALALAVATVAIPLLFALARPKLCDADASKAYIIHNKVAHTRLLPVSASHAFTYPTLFFLVSLRSLEAHTLDLGRGWLVGYGGISWRMLGLRASAYLHAWEPELSIIAKLRRVTRERGLDSEGLDDAWMLTMPSYLGFEGINPLTVYFCYAQNSAPLAVVLEIHNTFGERHVHVLEMEASEQECLTKGFTHHWTFPREFHVSPYNDRSGYYSVAVNMPPSPALATSSPVPRMRVLLHTGAGEGGSGVGPVKLAAFLTPIRCLPWTSSNILQSLLVQPFVLFLSMPRILYEAWRLHYKKGLSVYARPEQIAAVDGWGGAKRVGGGVGWQRETWAGALARRKIETFLHDRARETGISVTLLAANPAIPRKDFEAEKSTEEPRHLTISYLSPAFFTTLFTAPSFAHALLLCESSGSCHASSEALLRAVFADSPNDPGRAVGSWTTVSQQLRALQLPEPLRQSHPGLEIPGEHPIDARCSGMWAGAATALVLAKGIMSAWTQAWLYRATGASFVPGEEPWAYTVRWRRVPGPEEVEEETELGYRLGSVQRSV